MGRPRSAKQADTDRAERVMESWKLRTEGMTEQAIADRLGVSQPTVSRYLAEAFKLHATPIAKELRIVEVDKLDHLEQRMRAILDGVHVTVSGGKVVYSDADGQPISDPTPVMHAADRILRIAERRSKLLGLDAPSKVQADVTMPQLDPDIAKRIEAARRAVAEREAQIKGDQQ